MHWSRLLMVTALVLALAVGAAADYKWEQLPDHSEYGVSVDMTFNMDDMYILGDDFLCTQMGPLTEIQIFCSWAHDEPPMLDPNSVEFTIGIYSDIPDSVSGYSMPGDNLWTKQFIPGDFIVGMTTSGVKGWLSPPASYWYPCCEDVYTYTFQLDALDTFIQQGTAAEPVVYWLVVQGVPLVDNTKSIGWLASEDHWNDDGVWAWDMHPVQGGWAELIYPQEHPYAWDSIDLAFTITGEGAPIGEDFGDAPDPTYPTLLMNGGAMHPFIQGYQMGLLIDGELDGQPHPIALGDDNNGSPDEDGVTFSMPLMAGSTATMYVDMLSSSMGGYIDAWVDFGADGSWAEAGDQIVTSIWAPAGAITPFNFTVPASAMPGQTFARIRMSSSGGLNFFGAAMDGEVEDYLVIIEDGGTGEWKWEQLPDLETTGIDVNATEMLVLADDFLCEEPGRLTHIDVWGSWLEDMLPSIDDPMAIEFTLSIHEDIPANESPTGYSMPGEMLWFEHVPAGASNVELYAGNIVEGWMDPPDNYIMPGDWTCWMYSFDFPPEVAFHQTGTPDSAVVYWLDVQARPLDEMATFGWKTTADHWNDDAVWGMGLEPYFGPWEELVYPPQHEWAGQSIDLAFRLRMDYGTDVPDEVVPTRHGLRQNVPNPFNPITTIAYEVPAGGGHVTIEVFDVTGRLVTTLVDGHETEGVRTVTWNGTDVNGDEMATGVYFYRMTAGEEMAMRKMMLLK